MENTGKLWGRSIEVDTLKTLGTLGILLSTPLAVFYFYIACVHFRGSLWEPAAGLASGRFSVSDFIGFLPPFSLYAVVIFAVWLLFQIALYYLPDFLHRLLRGYVGGVCPGAVSPAGNRPKYRINGLQAWLITHVVFLTLTVGLGVFPASIIFDNWGGLLWVVNIAGYSLALFIYLKAHLFPTYPEDNKKTGNFIYDFYMGIELHPRIGQFDFKLFFNGRPGIVAWTLINISFAAAQYNLYGYVTNSMMIVNLLQGLYVVYFFWNEAWYLKTIDIAHDHFGWMLAWGDLVWLPYMYTLQGFYLVFNPVDLSSGYALFVLAVGLAGYAIFHSSNRQKELFRESKGQTLIWGKPPQSIEAEYQAANGEKRKSNLLTSGWWGVARHFNYTGDLILSLAYSLACGFGHVLPYFYFFFLATLLIHRSIRDERRCSEKYGTSWQKYCQKVPYRLIPGIF
jgi:7-dehydrocholesterol reductase